METTEPLNILVIEHDSEIASLFESLLVEKLSAAVTLAQDRASALQQLSSASFDLITLDSHLRDGDSLSLLKDIARDDAHPPVVMVTGRGEEESAVTAFHAGASGCVMKDEKLDVMLPAVLERALALDRTEKALQESEARYRAIFENTGAATLIVEDDTTISLVNTEATKLYGFSKEELEGKTSWRDFVHPDDLDKVMRYHVLRRQDPASVPKGYEYRLINRKGETRQVAVFAELLPGTRRTVASLLDITEKKEVEDALRRANAELEAFAGTVSHDLKGPLANIRLAINTLMDLLGEPLTERTRAAIDQTAQALRLSGERATGLVDELLKLAEAGQAPRGVACNDVNAVVETILGERASTIEEKGVRFEIDENLGAVVADYTHVYQVFTNLISNAIKYNDNAEPIVRVRRLGDDEEGRHRFLVCDNGPGIPDSRLDELFVAFVKGRLGGTGIGLAIVEKIIKVYGGSIKVYNDGGACFEFVWRDYAGRSIENC